MFSDASSFNQDLSEWKIDSVTSMNLMFSSASAFDQDLGWCVDDGVSLDYAFYNSSCYSTSCGVNWMAAARCGGNGRGTIDDSTIRLAVGQWVSNPALVEAAYGHISTWGDRWGNGHVVFVCGDHYEPDCKNNGADFNDDISAWDTSGVTDMSHMFSGASAFDQPLGGWRVDNLEDMGEMFKYAAVFNQDLSGWQIDKVDDMDSMFYSASAFDQDLGWCVKEGALPSGRSTFKGTKCEKTRCGVKREEFDTCDEVAIAFYKILLIVLLVLLPCFGACVCCCQKEDETYFAAARRVLRCCFCCCCICCRKKKEKSSVNSQPDASVVAADGCRVPANAPLVGVLKELSSFAFRERDEVAAGAGRTTRLLRPCGCTVWSSRPARKPRNSTASASRSRGRSTSSSTRARSRSSRTTRIEVAATVSPTPPRTLQIPRQSRHRTSLTRKRPPPSRARSCAPPRKPRLRRPSNARASRRAHRLVLVRGAKRPPSPSSRKPRGKHLEQPPGRLRRRTLVLGEAEPEPTEPKAEEMHQRRPVGIMTQRQAARCAPPGVNIQGRPAAPRGRGPASSKVTAPRSSSQAGLAARARLWTSTG